MNDYHQLECQGIVVQKRVHDSFINANQLLDACHLEISEKQHLLTELANHHQPSSTMIMSNDHDEETWIPLEQALQIAKQYGIDNELKPFLLNYKVSTSAARSSAEFLANHNLNTSSSPKMNKVKKEKIKHHTTSYTVKSTTKTIAHGTNTTTSSSTTLTLKNGPGNSMNSSLESPNIAHSSSNSRKRTILQVSDTFQNFKDRYRKKGRPNSIWNNTHQLLSDEPMSTTSPKQLSIEQKQILLTIFIDGSLDKIDEIYRENSKMNVNMSLDDQGNTALHWAAALGRLRILRHLIDCGGELTVMNFHSETPLMRAIYVGNNKFNHTFPELLEIMDDAIFTTDDKRQTLLHLLAYRSGFEKDLAMYYLHCIHEYIDLPENYPKKQIFLNAKDRTGDTALHIASRVGDIEAIQLLIKMGSDRRIKNLAGKLASDCAIPNTLTHQYYFPILYEAPTVPEESDEDIPSSPIDTPVLEIFHFLSYVKEKFKKNSKKRKNMSSDEDATLGYSSHIIVTNKMNSSSTENGHFTNSTEKRTSSTFLLPEIHKLYAQIESLITVKTINSAKSSSNTVQSKTETTNKNDNSSSSSSSLTITSSSSSRIKKQRQDSNDRAYIEELYQKYDQLVARFETLKTSLTETDSSTPELTWSSPEQQTIQEEPHLVQQELDKIKSLLELKLSFKKRN